MALRYIGGDRVWVRFGVLRRQLAIVVEDEGGGIVRVVRFASGLKRWTGPAWIKRSDIIGRATQDDYRELQKPPCVH